MYQRYYNIYTYMNIFKKEKCTKCARTKLQEIYNMPGGAAGPPPPGILYLSSVYSYTFVFICIVFWHVSQHSWQLKHEVIAFSSIYFDISLRTMYLKGFYSGVGNRAQILYSHIVSFGDNFNLQYIPSAQLHHY